MARETYVITVDNDTDHDFIDTIENRLDILDLVDVRKVDNPTE